MLKTAIIGAGKIFDSHLKAIAQLDRLKAVAVADVQGEKAQEAGRRYGLHSYTDYRVMLEKEKPDLVIVALPHWLHKEAAIDCARAGAHMLIEKPMALTVGECDEMIGAARQHRVQLMVGLTQHYIRENRVAKQIVKQGDLGKLVMINDTRHQLYNVESRPEWFFHKAQAGGGILTNLGAHSIDKIQWLLDSPIRKVKAHLSYHVGRGDIEGSGALFLETENHIPATVVQSGYEGVPVNETQLIFTKGMLRLATGKSLWISDQGRYREVEMPEAQDPFKLQLMELIDVIDGVRPLESSGEYAKSINAVLEGIYRSSETGTEIEIFKTMTR
ncbi:Gfo/Idh/MocA family oxidoreductase [Paenibacillus filicis]|uniref:Gfo/Idh/MocA family oxidoreductase n=1 Tax=Paenibacillus gyeongsangnamensis TaxID=3388067 RepID=A0ABT4QJ48_9BACL|nr:Gfo/Idh/MocA family oxidoreductase [Paenibacillus filicis]MCZ8516908.1 Gfo/Idh/MocA family oxidoreductase [Paenibacillus filicis]